MAYDKLVDSTQLDADLTSVANAIRTKGGTSASLAFPSGFVTAIGNISGGGGGSTLIEKSISANGTYNASSDSADGYSKVVVSVPASAVDSGTKSITANGNNQDVVGYAAVNVNVPNTYAAGDEGKVVSSGALVAQTAHAEVTQNGTIDTTLNNSVTVNVSGSSGLVYEEGTYTAASDSIPTISFANTHAKAPDIVVFADVSASSCATGNTLTSFTYVDFSDMFGSPMQLKSDTTWSKMYMYSRLATTLASASGSAEYSRSEITASDFKPFGGTTAFLCRSGQTYKWIAEWR